MDIIPAVDIKGGKCVRLYQGDYSKETVFSEDPLAVALNWQAQGAARLHLVDLDGAGSGKPRNIDLIDAIVKRVSVPVQLGGGIRDEATVAKMLDIGVNRVILGTAAVENPRDGEEIMPEIWRGHSNWHRRQMRLRIYSWLEKGY